jgi:signal peptidase I
VTRIVLATAVMLTGLVVVLGAIVLARPSYVEVEVRGDAMLPTLRAGDRVAVDNEAVPRRGDMVVFDNEALTGRDPGERVLRVIGVAGDRLAYTGGQLTVNDKPAAEPFVTGQGTDFTVTVPEDAVFLAGDDRQHSDAANRGTLPVDAVDGQVVAVNGTLLDANQDWLIWVAGGAVVALAGLGWLIVGLYRRTAIPAPPTD